jgi:hypothetical protein
MSWKPDISPMAKAVAEFINSKPCSRSLEEPQALLRKGYLESRLADEERMLSIETCLQRSTVAALTTRMSCQPENHRLRQDPKTSISVAEARP